MSLAALAAAVKEVALPILRPVEDVALNALVDELVSHLPEPDTPGQTQAIAALSKGEHSLVKLITHTNAHDAFTSACHALSKLRRLQAPSMDDILDHAGEVITWIATHKGFLVGASQIASAELEDLHQVLVRHTTVDPDADTLELKPANPAALPG